MGKTVRWAWYPWLFALYPVIYLYSVNRTLVRDNQVLQALVVVLLAVTIIFALLRLLTKNTHQAAAMTLVIEILFLTYGHIHSLLERTTFQGEWLMPVMVALAAIIVMVILRSRAAWRGVSPYLNLIVAFLLLLPSWQVGAFWFESGSAVAESTATEYEPVEATSANSSDRPDIYYIILDGYPSNSYFLRENNFDNSAFTDALEDRGFYVAYDSKSNYNTTLVSLASSLNMRYIDASDNPGTVHHELHMRSLVADNRVAHELQTRGYTYIFMLSGFAVPSTLTDMNVEFYPEGPEYFSSAGIRLSGEDDSWHYEQPFWPLFLETTLLRSMASRINVEQAGMPYPWNSARRVLATYKELERIPEIEAATFTFAHFIKPHNPITFDRNGNVIDENDAFADPETYFFEQLHYINTRTLEMIDHILAESSVPPIIILQADHGSNLGHGRGQDGTEVNLEILNAIHLPGSEAQDLLYPSLSPVNTFRLILNHYFGADFDLLEDRHYDVPKEYEDMFFHVEIADDGRINVDKGDHIAIIYPDEEGELQVYSADEEKNPDELLLTISSEDIAPYRDEPPEQNTLILSEDPIALYALDTGEFQFNIGPGPRGREWAVVIDDIPPTLIHGYEVNAN